MRWHQTLLGIDTSFSLYIHASEVARVYRYEDGWRAMLMLGDRRKFRDCSSLESGKDACEQWASRHRDRFNAEYEELKRSGIFRAFNPEKSDRPGSDGNAS